MDGDGNMVTVVLDENEQSLLSICLFTPALLSN